jgi:hypothetical protein
LSNSTVFAGNSPGALRRTTSAPNDLAGSQERHQQPRPITDAQDDVVHRRGRQVAQIGDLVGLMRFGQQPDRRRNLNMHIAHRGDHVLGHPECRA